MSAASMSPQASWRIRLISRSMGPWRLGSRKAASNSVQLYHEAFCSTGLSRGMTICMDWASGAKRGWTFSPVWRMDGSSGWTMTWGPPLGSWTKFSRAADAVARNAPPTGGLSPGERGCLSLRT